MAGRTERVSARRVQSDIGWVTRGRWFRRLVVWGALAGLFELVAMAVGPFYLPTLEAMWSGAVSLALEGDLTLLGESLIQMLIGFGIATGVGIPVGAAMGSSRRVDQVLGMYVRALFVMSLAALLPLLIILFGFGFVFNVTVVFLFGVLFISLNTAAGVREVPKDYLDLAHAYEASRLRVFIQIQLPSALPFVISGMRLGLANSFSGMIVAELWVTRDIGLVLQHLALSRDLPKLFAVLVIVTALAGIAAACLKAAERYIAPWGRVAK